MRSKVSHYLPSMESFRYPMSGFILIMTTHTNPTFALGEIQCGGGSTARRRSVVWGVSDVARFAAPYSFGRRKQGQPSFPFMCVFIHSRLFDCTRPSAWYRCERLDIHCIMEIRTSSFERRTRRSPIDSAERTRFTRSRVVCPSLI